MTPSLQIIGDWKKGITQPLEAALLVSVDICGRNGAQACAHAMIRMAMSARANTVKSKSMRPIKKDAGGDQYVEVVKNGRTIPVYKFQFAPDAKAKGWALSGTWEKAKKIANAGLAQRSWFWGLSALGAQSSNPIAGAFRFYTVKQPKVAGYIKENRMNYIFKAFPESMLPAVEQSAVASIMQSASRKICDEFSRAELISGHKANSVATYFLGGA